jgi:uncharacterized lipoprotein YmbA
MKTHFLCCALFALAVSACASSPQIRYYTLSTEADLKAQVSSAAPVNHKSYTVGAVTIPNLLDRPQIVLRSSANTIEVLDYDRWAAPLSDELQRVLIADLSMRLGGNSIIDPGLISSLRMDRRITISILEFDPARKNESVLEASWTISDAKSGLGLDGVQTYKARHVASTDHSNVAELVATMSALVAKMTDDIAATVLAEE